MHYTAIEKHIADGISTCPFCGSEGDVMQGYVECYQCGARGPVNSHTDPDFIDSWDRRITANNQIEHSTKG